MNNRTLYVLWVDTTFNMRTWAKYTIGASVVLACVLTAMIEKMFRWSLDKMSPLIEWFLVKLFKFMYK